MLPQPVAQASQLSKIKMLQQRRFDNWGHYYNQALKLIEALPSAFEEAIVRQFVDGIWRDSLRKQCKQWLNSRGWKWDNVVSFGRLNSQTPSETVTETISDMLSISRYAEKMAKIRRGCDKAKTNENSSQHVRPLRRSQRLMSKDDFVQTQQSMADIQGLSTPNEADALIPILRKTATLHVSDSRLRDELRQTLSIVQNETRRRSGLEDCKDVRRGQPATTKTKNSKAKKTPIARKPNEHTLDAQGTDVGTKGKTLATGTSPITPQRKADVVADVAKPAQQAKKTRALGNPIPRLVPLKRQVTEDANDSSNDEGFLYTPKQPSKRRADRRKTYKRRRLPLPPPPEIPILPTSDDE